MKPLYFGILILLLILQIKLWFNKGGIIDMFNLKKQISAQQVQNLELQQRNAVLVAKIKALKANNAVIETKARNDLGMIQKGETFYQVTK